MASKKRKSQSFLQGSIVLLSATFLVKIIGMLFKIPLTSLITEIGMGYFSTAYSFFTVFQTIAIAGFPAAISRLVAENIAHERYRDVKRVYRVALKVFLVTGTLGTIAMFIGSFFYCRFYLEDMNYLPAMLVMCPCVFFYCMMSVNRGYFQGLRNMTPTAVSQVMEALSKLILGLGFSNLIINWGVKQYKESGVVFGTAVENAEQAKIASLPYAAAGAILAVTIGTVLGMIFLMIRRNIWGDGITRADLGYAPKPRSQRYILRSLLVVAIPVALASLANNLSTIIDTVTIQGGLKSLVENQSEIMLEQYGSMANIDTMETFIWGAYSALALTLFNLVPTITGAFGSSALPTVTSSWALRDIPGTKRSIESIMRITALVAVPAGFGLSALARPILVSIFGDRAGVDVAAPLVAVLGVAVIFVAMTNPVHSMLQAVGQASFIVKALLITAVIKFILNFALIRIPVLNINGAPIGTFVSYVFLLVVDVMCLSRTTRIRFNYGAIFGKPLIAGILCAVSAYFVNLGMSKWIPTLLPDHGYRVITIICVAISVIVAVIVYSIVILAVRGITKNEVLMLPKGEKIAAILEKRHLIG